MTPNGSNFKAAEGMPSAAIGSMRGTPRGTLGLDRWPGHGGYAVPSRQELH